MPGGLMRAFCDPVTATSTPQASVSKGIAPRLLTASTMRRAGWSPRTSRTARTSLWTPVLVSLWVTKTALYSGPWAFTRSAMASSGTGRPHPDSEFLGDGSEALAEVAVVDGEDAVPRREEIGHRRLEASGPRGDQRDHVVPRLEHLLQTGQDLSHETSEGRAAVVGHLLAHGVEHLWRQRRGAGDQEIDFGHKSPPRSGLTYKQQRSRQGGESARGATPLPGHRVCPGISGSYHGLARRLSHLAVLQPHLRRGTNLPLPPDSTPPGSLGEPLRPARLRHRMPVTIITARDPVRQPDARAG